MRIKIDKTDQIFSKYIRKRDGKCMRCGSKVEFNYNGDPVSHQNSHFWGRGKENTRFDPLNADCLCFACHRLWGGDEREEYIAFKKKQLGEKEYKDLDRRAHTTGKKDRKLEYIKWSLAYRNLKVE